MFYIKTKTARAVANAKSRFLAIKEPTCVVKSWIR
jgi:hypothetical protein